LITMKFWKYAELTAPELVSAVRKCPIFFIPTGLLEWHGNHLPLGFDALKAERICLQVAKRTGGIVLPPNFWGVAGFGSFAGTLIFRRKTIKALFLELFEQLEKVGARIIVLLTGHYGDYQVSLVKEAAKEYTRKHRVRITAMPEYEDVISDNGTVPADHADKWETSFGLALMPDLIKMRKFKPGKCKIHKYNSKYTIPAYRRMEEHEWIWRSDLRKTASAALGRRMLRRIVIGIADKVEKLKREVKIS
jgi:creatinine amidohydrolase